MHVPPRPLSMPQADRTTLEICVETPDGLFAAQDFADRIELCSALDIGGLTPSPGVLRLAVQSRVPVHVLIRPRAGDFTYSDAELASVIADIETVRDLGLAGVVIGAARDGRLDTVAIDRMARAAGPLELTLHRVIDTLTDPVAAVELAAAKGFARILTSGGAAAAVDGLSVLAEMERIAAGRITIMAGGGVTASNVAQIAQATGIRDFHASCSRQQPIASHHQRLGFGQLRRVTAPTLMAALRAALTELPAAN